MSLCLYCELFVDFCLFFKCLFVKYQLICQSALLFDSYLGHYILFHLFQKSVFIAMVLRLFITLHLFGDFVVAINNFLVLSHLGCSTISMIRINDRYLRRFYLLQILNFIQFSTSRCYFYRTLDAPMLLSIILFQIILNPFFISYSIRIRMIYCGNPQCVLFS